MTTTSRAIAACATALLLLLAVSACDDGGTNPPSGREPRTILVPDEMDLEEAAREAVAGDTLLLRVFFPIPPVGETVTFRAAQTPLFIRGDKSLPLISGTGDFALLRFESPKAGTQVEAVAFSGGSPAIEVVGTGGILVSACRFTGGSVQIRGSGSGLTLHAEGNLLETAAGFAMEAADRCRLVATQNTVIRPDEVGILLAGQSEGLLTANIVLPASGAAGIECRDGSQLLPESGCNDLFGSLDNAYVGCVAPATDFQLDPQFCDAAHGVYTLVSTSPCAPLNSGGCGRIGARDVACEPEIPATGPPILPRGSR